MVKLPFFSDEKEEKLNCGILVEENLTVSLSKSFIKKFDPLIISICFFLIYEKKPTNISDFFNPLKNKTQKS